MTSWRFWFFWGALTVIGCATRDQPEANPELDSTRTDQLFLALGDSYTIGESVAPHDSWPMQLARMLRTDGTRLADPTIVAQTGWTTAQLAASINAAKLNGEFDLVSLLIGVNNQYQGRTPNEYRGQLCELLTRAIELAGGEPSRVIVLSIPDWGVTPFAQGKDRSGISAAIDEFNEINQDESLKAAVRYIDITGISRKARDDQSLLADDGLHPSAAMYRQWAEEVLPVARDILQSRAGPN